MEIISHRGLWVEQIEKNSPKAFEESFKNNFGTETDIRDFNGELVISHDIANDQSTSFVGFLDQYNHFNSKGMLALNIKSDGLQSLIKRDLEHYNIENYFVFDMSIPDALGYLKIGLNVYIRQSEFEQNMSLMSHFNVKGVWLDAFNGLWYNHKMIEEYLYNQKHVAIVSAELHGRDPIETWSFIKEHNLHLTEGVILCTDYPFKAKEYFYEQ